MRGKTTKQKYITSIIGRAFENMQKLFWLRGNNEGERKKNQFVIWFNMGEKKTRIKLRNEKRTKNSETNTRIKRRKQEREKKRKVRKDKNKKKDKRGKAASEK